MFFITYETYVLNVERVTLNAKLIQFSRLKDDKVVIFFIIFVYVYLLNLEYEISKITNSKPINNALFFIKIKISLFKLFYFAYNCIKFYQKNFPLVKNNDKNNCFKFTKFNVFAKKSGKFITCIVCQSAFEIASCFVFSQESANVINEIIKLFVRKKLQFELFERNQS